LVACLNAVCWSIITPPFQSIDEPAHFAYTQQLAENESLPTSSEFGFSPEEFTTLIDVHQTKIHGRPAVRAISTAAEQRVLEEDTSQRLPRFGNGGAGGAASGPPLYYLLEVLPYGLGSSGSVLDRLELMRLFSALMGGITALFVFLFVREALPSEPWAWTVGGLGAALAPELGYMSGALNPDALLFAVSAAIFYCLARAFRRGLTLGLAATIGGLMAAGLLTKVNFIGLTAGVTLGLVILAVRVAHVSGRGAAVRMLATALGIAASPVFLYAFVNLLSNRPVLGIVSTTLRFHGRGHSISDMLSYIWQFYLPRLPGMVDYFHGISTTRQLWFNRAVGVYGWLDTSFPIWVYKAALLPAGLITLLWIRGLALGRRALRRRFAEVAVYAAMSVGLMVLIGAAAYFNSESENIGFVELRYLMPLLALAGVGLALAARGAGRRMGPAVGALIVLLLLAHDIFSQLLVVGRFYG
jgi:4-amino-4-deoxy-L-arabinose transferase-like glycosyltransferase